MWKPSISASAFERPTSTLLVRLQHIVLAMFPVCASNVASRICWKDDSARNKCSKDHSSTCSRREHYRNAVEIPCSYNVAATISESASELGRERNSAQGSREQNCAYARASAQFDRDCQTTDGDDSVDQGSGASSDERGDDEIARGIEPPIDSEETQTNAADEADQAEVNSPAPESAGSTKSQSKPRIDRRERRKRGNAHVAGHSVHQGGQPSSSRNLFLREVTMLEEEIKILTTQLNQKLHLQNTQLKKMLERFEDS